MAVDVDVDCVKVLVKHKGTDIFLGRSYDGRVFLYGACGEILWLVGKGEAKIFGKIRKFFKSKKDGK